MNKQKLLWILVCLLLYLRKEILCFCLYKTLNIREKFHSNLDTSILSTPKTLTAEEQPLSYSHHCCSNFYMVIAFVTAQMLKFNVGRTEVGHCMQSLHIQYPDLWCFLVNLRNAEEMIAERGLAMFWKASCLPHYSAPCQGYLGMFRIICKGD